jgi:hypothetical protein
MQNLSNHRRFSPIHHFFLTPLLITLFVWSIVYCVQNGFSFATIYFLVGSFILNLITLISRSYALKNQDRIIRIEMRFRYFELTGNSFSDKEKHLKMGQIIALRFAGDNELAELTEKAISDNLTSNQIKIAIKNWLADNNRV